MRERGGKRRELICFHKTRVEKKHFLSAPLTKVEMKRRKGFLCVNRRKGKEKKRMIYTLKCVSTKKKQRRLGEREEGTEENKKKE